VRRLFLAAALVTASPAVADSIARELPLEIDAPAVQTQYVHIKLKGLPSFVYINRADKLSNLTDQTVLIKDARTGEVISVVRQNDTLFEDAYFYLPARFIGQDRKAHLVLQPSSPWIVKDAFSANPVQVLSLEAAPADRYQTYEIVFGKPDDQPFLVDNISYAEGAYRTPGWVWNKFFRYGNDPSTFLLPLEAGKAVFLKPNFYLSANALFVIDGKEIAIFERSLGERSSQDFYRTRLEVSGRPVHDMRVQNVAPFRAMPTNLRQMAFAFNSIEIATPRPAPPVRLNVVDLLNTRLDYRHGHSARAALLNPTDAVAELLKYQGGAFLPSRDPVALPAGSRRHADAVVLLDPILNDIASTAYSTGDVWVNSAVGAAMMLEKAGYSVAYANPADLARLRPKVVYVPTQPFYRNILDQAVFDQLAASGAKVIIDPSFSGEFINNQVLWKATGVQYIEGAELLVQDEVVFQDQAKTDTFQASIVFSHKALDAKPEASLKVAGPLAYSKPAGSGSVSALMTPAAYYFFNYGLRPDTALLHQLLKGAAKPTVTARSASQVRAYVIRQTACTADVMVENNNVGAYNYYGFATVTASPPPSTPPPVSRVTLDGALFAGRKWSVSGPVKSEPSASGVTVLSLTRDTVVSLVDRGCGV
jgi:hypothetical protein